MINSMKSLYFIFALSIFLNHLTFINSSPQGKFIFDNYFHNGGFGVVFFFLSSGFMLALKYVDNYKTVTYDNYKDFIIRRISKTYPLYFITMTVVFVVSLISQHSIADSIKLLVKLALCIPMMQTLTIKYWGLFNSAAWFISCLFILHLLTPLILKFSYSIRDNNKIILSLLLLAYLTLCLAFFATRQLISAGYITEVNWEFLVYTTPYFRIFDFLIGICLGMYFKNKRISKNFNKTSFSIIEVLSVGIALFIYFWGIHQNLYIVTLAYIPIMTLVIYVFAFDSGVISRLLATPYLVRLGNISMDFYLIHYVVILYGGAGLIKYFGHTPNLLIIFCILLFMLSASLAVVSHRFIALPKN
jgi:peptidoglycan/LPS O-acetylase OafA/YrhL